MKLTLIGIVISAFLAIFKMVAGIYGNSYALIADGIESSGDVFSSSLLLVGLWFSQRPPDENHPYGHGRAETLATLLIVLFLVASASIIVYESIKHILTPHHSPAPFTLVVLLIVVLIKEALFRYIQKHNDSNSALEAESMHHRSDAITSLAAFFGISIALLMGDGWENADDWAAILAAIIIYYNAWLIFRPTLADLMDEDRFDDLRQEVIALVERETKIVQIEECFVRKIGSQFVVDLKIIVPEKRLVCEICKVTTEIRAKILQEIPNIQKLVIEIAEP